MKKSNLLFWALSLLVLLFSCEREKYTEQDALKSLESFTKNELVRDSLNNVGGIISYSVMVIPASDKSFLKSNFGKDSLDSAYVTVSQWGKVVTKKVDKSGIVVFEDMRIGTISVSVNANNYTSVDYIAEIIPERDSVTLAYYNVVRYASTMIPVFSTVNNMSTIKGQITFENDLTNKAPEYASGVEIVGIIDINDASTFASNYLPYFYDEGDQYYNDVQNTGNIRMYYDNYTGQIRQMAYGNTQFRTTTDSMGNYSLKVPSSNDGLDIKLAVSEFAADQKLLLNTLNNEQIAGVKSIRTFFSSQIRTTPAGGTTPSVIPWVPGAYVSFSVPTGNANLQPKTGASGTAIIGESGISSITVSNQGSGYTQAPLIILSLGSGYNAIRAEATAIVNNGKITGVTITNPGQGYTSGDVPTVTVKDVLQAATAPTPIFTYSVYDYTLNTTTGHNLTSNTPPTVTVTSTTGSGAKAEAILSGSISNIILNNGGSDYTDLPTIAVSMPSAGIIASPTTATATATMTSNNPIHSMVALPTLTNGAFWFENTPTVTITGTGSGAAAVCELKTDGRVERIVLNNAGTGYTTAPTVTITGGGGSGATAYATIAAGQVTVNLMNRGTGYTTAPTIVIDAPAVGGTQATATTVLAYQVKNLTLTNGGSGYGNTSAGSYSILSNITTVLTATNLTQTLTLGSHYAPFPSMKVASVAFTGGTGYASAPSLTFIPKNQHGSGASATAEMLYNIVKVKAMVEGSGYKITSDVRVIVEAPSAAFTTLPTVTPTLGKGILAEVQAPAGLGGDGYLASPYITTNLPAGNPDRFARISAVVTNGTITGYNVDDAGAGYPYSTAYTTTITTNLTGGGFTALVNKQSGMITGVNITGAGQGYVVPPYIEFVYGTGSNTNGTPATATATLVDGRISEITITNPGSGYYVAPTVNFVVPSNAAEAKGYASFDAYGSITAISLIGETGTVGAAASGYGYITAPEVTITPTVSGLGRDASAIAKIQNGRVISVEIVNKGYGYLAKNTPGPTTTGFTKTPTFNAAYNTISFPTDAGVGFTVRPIAVTSVDLDNNFQIIKATAAKSYVRDIYLGTGIRSTDASDN